MISHINHQTTTIGILTIVAGLVVAFIASSFYSSQQPSEKYGSMNARNRDFLFNKVSTQRLRDVLREFSRLPHPAGSERNNELGRVVRDTWESYGFETKTSFHDVLLSYLGSGENFNRAEIINSKGESEFVTQRSERKLTQHQGEPLPPYNAFAKSGVAESNSIYYVNFCRDEDFEWVTQHKKLDLAGTIIICRYGNALRGHKTRNAERHGAVGLLLYKDPEENVDTRTHRPIYNDTVPNSWFLPPSGTERGAVLDCSGDPLTPGFTSKDYILRKEEKDLHEDGTIPNIIVHPVSYGDMVNFMRLLTGEKVKSNFQGKLEHTTYRYGGPLKDKKKIKIINNNYNKKGRIMNVFGIIKGAVEPDRYVLMGNHRDAWGYGAQDPVSGTAIMMETSHVYAQLTKTGWRPRRTMIFCSWDGGEFGLTGSVEFTEEMRMILSERAVAYLNCDSGVIQTHMISAFSTPLMYNLIHNSAKQVKLNHGDDEMFTWITLYDQWLNMSGIHRDKPPISDIAGGSDYSAFTHRLGITSADIVYYYEKKKMGITGYYPTYHTSYDVFENVEHFVDPSFSAHKALTQLFIEMTRSLSDDRVLPFTTHAYAVRLKDIFHNLNQTVYTKLRSKNLGTSLDFLDRALAHLSSTTLKLDRRLEKLKDMSNQSDIQLRQMNDRLHLFERAFQHPLGVYGNKDIRRVVRAADWSNCYTCRDFPGVTAALKAANRSSDDQSWKIVKNELNKVISTVESAADWIDLDLIV